jgi:putative peptidoglycan binding protein
MASYSELRRGDRLPTVGVLQKLLNRSGANLRVDGAFGHKTLAALVAFQRQRNLPVNGSADQATWARLIFKSNLPVLDCVDVFDPALYEGDAANIRAAGGEPLLMGGMSRGTLQAATDIVARGRNVFLLRIIGHGSPGHQHVAWGAGGWDEVHGTKKKWHQIHGDPLSSLHIVNATLARQLGLGVIFGDYGCMELHGCQVALGPRGHQFIRTLARQIGIPVSAGLRYQVSTFRFDGPTFTAFPDGESLGAWCARLPDFPPITVP